MNARWTGGVLRATRAAGTCDVIKVGGSLLTLPTWPDLVEELVRDRAAGRSVIIVVGGGPIVEGLRVLDAAVRGDPALMHGLAIDLMGTTARLVAATLGLPLRCDDSGMAQAVLDVPRWLAAEGRLARLPQGWHVTSDSIAAFVASETDGDLLLAKRAPPPPCHRDEPFAALARAGWVDESFPTAAARLSRIAWAVPNSVPEPGGFGTTGERRRPGGP